MFSRPALPTHVRLSAAPAKCRMTFSVRPCRTAALTFVLLAAASCTSEDTDAAGGDGSGAGTPAAGDAEAAADAPTGDAHAGGDAAASTPCGLAADHEVVFTLGADGWTLNTESRGGRTIWTGRAPVEGSAGPIAPGQTLSVTVTFDPPLRVARDAGTLNLRFAEVTRGRGELRAVFRQEVNTAGTLAVGADATGDWRLDAERRAASVALSAVGVLPTTGKSLSCLSTRVSLNPVGYDANDNSALDTQPGGSVSWNAVEVEVVEPSEVASEPFGFDFGE